MKSIKTTDITTSAAAKIKKGTLEHLQEAHKETVKQLAISLIGESYDAGTYYILYGCVDSGSGLNHDISEGAIFAAGEIYLSPQKTFTSPAAQVPVFGLSTTYVSDSEHDPTTFTDGSTHNIHQDKTNDWDSIIQSFDPVEFSEMVRLDTLNKTTLTAASGFYTLANANCRKNRNGLVSLAGLVTCNAGALVLQTITTLPVGYRPLVAYTMFTKLYNTGAYLDCAISVATNGVVTIGNAGGGALLNYILSLDVINFYNN